MLAEENVVAEVTFTETSGGATRADGHFVSALSDAYGGTSDGSGTLMIAFVEIVYISFVCAEIDLF